MRNYFIFFHLESDARRNQEQDKSEEEENLEPVGGEPDIPDLVWKTKVNLSSNRNFCSKTQPILFKLDEWCNIGHLGFWVATHLLIHPDLTDGGGDVVDAGHGGVLQGHVVLQGAVVHAHWPWLVDKGNREAGGEPSVHVSGIVVIDGGCDCFIDFWVLFLSCTKREFRYWRLSNEDSSI